MKKLKYLFVLPACGLFMLGIQACKKSFLDKQPLGAIGQSILTNKIGVQGLLIGAYAKLRGNNNWGSSPSNWGFGSVAGGDSYKGSTAADQSSEGLLPLALWSYDATNGYVREKYTALYDGAQRANEVLRTMALATDLTADDQKTMAGEARFLRGYYHLEAKQMWKNPPYVDETISVDNANVNVPNVDEAGNFIDIWPKVEADFQFAIDNLPETQPQRGRANKWAAMAFLVKCYMFEDKYAEAKPLLDQLITAGKTAGGQPYALNAVYEANFNGATDNTAESVFAVQFSVQDGSGTNGRYGDNLALPNGGVYGCCGFNNPSTTLANAHKTDAAGLPLLDTYNTGQNIGDPANPYTGNLDPRIDWSIGRPGIPYFDFGPVPTGPAAAPTYPWIREVVTNGYFSPKKNAYAKAQVGSVSSTETSFWGPSQQTSQNYDIIRFAEILLWGAEVENAPGGDANKALDYVNRVRNRAANPDGWVYLTDYDASKGTYKIGTPADKYKISPYPAGAFADKTLATKAIMHERYIELAMEGKRFFDLQRWDNGTGFMANVLNAYAAAERPRLSIYNVNPTASFEKGKDEYFPLPQGQIDIENSTGTIFLKQDPAYQ